MHNVVRSKAMERVLARVSQINETASIGILETANLGNNTFSVLASVDKDMDEAGFQQAIAKNFDGNFSLVEGSVRYVPHPQHKLARFALVANIQSQALVDGKLPEGYTQVNASVASDAQGQPWRIVDIDGNKRLVQTATENYDQLLAARKSRMMVTASAELTTVAFANGDYATYVNPETAKLSDGVLLNVEGKFMVIDRATEKMLPIHASQVVEAMSVRSDEYKPVQPHEVNAALTSDRAKFVLDYMQKLYKNTAFMSKLQNLMGRLVSEKKTAIMLPNT